MITLGIIAHCQLTGLVASVRSLAPSVRIVDISIATLASRQGRDEALARLRNADKVWSVPLYAAYGDFASKKIHSTFANVLILPSVIFTGFHPDMTYVGRRYSDVRSPVGDYHSRIVLSGFLSGRSSEETVRMFNPLVYAKLGYFDAYHRDLDALAMNFEEAGLKLGSAIEGWCEAGCFMHTINHPKAFVLFDVARAALATSAIAALPEPRAEEFEDLLEAVGSFPVYPELAEALGVEGSLSFTLPGSDGDPEAIDVAEFVRRSYEIYACAPPEALHGVGVDRALRDVFDGSDERRARRTRTGATPASDKDPTRGGRLLRPASGGRLGQGERFDPRS